MNKKTFMAAIIISALLISPVEMQLVDVTKANPHALRYPTFTLCSPSQGGIYEINKIPLNLQINLYTHLIIGGYIETINPLYYQIDEQTPVPLTVTYIPPYPQPDYPSMVYAVVNCSLPPLVNGLHNLTIWGKAHQDPEAEETSYGGSYSENISTSITFRIEAALPTISNVSIENKTFFSNQIPLSFEVNETTSWTGFSLDNQANVTTNGNVTLTDLTEGNHSIIVYANDTIGNMGKSDTIIFAISLPKPTPSLPFPPSPSPTEQPTAEPTETPNPTNGDNQTMDLTPILLLSGVAVIAAAVGALFYLKRRKP